MRFAGFRLCALGLLLVALCAGHAAAKQCRPSSESHSVWKHEGGMFKRQPNGKDWVEYNKEGEPGSTFTEKMKEGASTIVIHDNDREIDILLRDDLAGLRNKDGEEGKFQQLYQGSWMKVLDCT